MHFLTPWWGLLFLPLAAGIIILYLLKLRRRDVVVSSTLLWQQVLRDYQADAVEALRRAILKCHLPGVAKLDLPAEAG